MRRPNVLLAAVATAVVMAACADVPTSSRPTASMASGQFGSVVAGTCTTLGELNTLATALFVTGQPNVSSVLGKLKSLDGHVRRGRLAEAVALAHEIADFTLLKNSQRSLGGTEEQLDAFLNDVYCYAGIDVDIEDPDNTFLIFPSDEPQVITDTSGTAGISFDGNPVLEPTLVEFAFIEGEFEPGDGPLDTKLDQYPGFIAITKTSETGAPLAKPAVVGVCASGAIPQEVRDRLRLGHGASDGFEITPPASADFLTCENAVADAGAQPLWARLAQLILPKPAHASAVLFEGGGVGGTVTEFSPFAPVDPELSFSGGVGGTVTEFVLDKPVTDLVTTAATAFLVDCSAPMYAGPVPAECRPQIAITTRLGTPLVGVPVEWTVGPKSLAEIAPRTTYCGTYGQTASTTTNALGLAGICWTIHTPRTTNTVRAVPLAGGDAPAGVTFAPAETTFNINTSKGQPTVLEVVSGNGQIGSPGATLVDPVVVRVLDGDGNPKAGIPVSWVMTTSGGSMSPIDLVTDADGLARGVWTLGPDTGEQLFTARISSFIQVLVMVTATAVP